MLSNSHSFAKLLRTTLLVISSTNGWEYQPEKNQWINATVLKMLSRIIHLIWTVGKNCAIQKSHWLIRNHKLSRKLTKCWCASSIHINFNGNLISGEEKIRSIHGVEIKNGANSKIEWGKFYNDKKNYGRKNASAVEKSSIDWKTDFRKWKTVCLSTCQMSYVSHVETLKRLRRVSQTLISWTFVQTVKW